MAGGLPSLAGSITSLIDDVILDAKSITNLLFPTPRPIYGIYDNEGGTEILTGYASVVGFSFQADEKVAGYPIEQGGFASYNKVAMPFSGRIEYLVIGDAKSNFIAKLEALRSDTNTYLLVSPEYSWQNVNVTHHDHRRDPAHGFDMVTFTVWLEEIRTPAGNQFTGTNPQADPTNTKSPDAQAQQGGANVQAIPAKASGLLPSADAQTYSQIMGENVAPAPQVAGGGLGG